MRAGSGRSAELLAKAPLPIRDGVAPSRVHLPPGPWPTLLDYLCERFPYLPIEILKARLERGEIVDEHGTPQAGNDPYVAQRWLWYYREAPDEQPIPFELTILHRDSRLIVVDKPHFLASIPGGRYLKETALTRLRLSLAVPHLTPVHRLDRETAGVMLFCCDPASRGAYQSLFQSRDVIKVYEAVAPILPDLSLPRVHRSNLRQKPSHFTMEEIAGVPNSETLVELLARRGDLGLYRLSPHTGRKHQLRAHMAAMGVPICNDAFYPVLQPYSDTDDFTRPLQLLARSVAFVDPFSGEKRRFESQRTLAMW